MPAPSPAADVAEAEADAGAGADEEALTGDERGRRRSLALVGATAVVVAVHLLTSRLIPGPTIVFDEAGYLGNARWLAGVEPTFEMPWSPAYAFGYPAVIAPLSRLLPDPDQQWAGIHVVNSLLLGSLVPLLHLTLRRVLGARPGPALLGAVVGALTPAVVGTAGWATAENLTLPLVVASVLALHAALTAERVVARVWFGPVVAVLFAAHARYVLVVAIVAVALLVGLVAAAVPRAVAAANLAALVVGVAGARFVQAAVEEARWESVSSLQGDPGDVVDMATSVGGLQTLVRAAVGQGWYLVVGLVGAVLLGGWVWLGLVRGRDQITPDSDVARARRITAALTFAMAAAVFVTSVAFFARNQLRDDHLVYGRHNDSFVPLWIASAVALLATDLRPARVLRLLAGTTIVTALVGVAVGLTLDPEVHGGRFATRAVPALGRVVDGSASSVSWRTLAVALLVLGAGALVVAVTRRPVAAVAVLALWSAWVGVDLVGDAAESTGRSYDGHHLPDDVERLGIDEASLDVSGRGSVAVVMYQFALPDVHLRPYWPGRDAVPVTAYAFDSLDDPALLAEGARLALVDEGGAFEGREPPALGLWVRPGSEQDRLAADGRLLPEGFPGAALPASARRASLVDGAPFAVEAGDVAHGTVVVRHSGTGAPWPDAGSVGDHPDEGAVVLSVSGLRDATGAPVTPGVVVDLPRWTVPGDEVEVPLAVAARDDDGRPVPPGRYQLELRVAQVGRWTAPVGTIGVTVT